MAARTGGDLAIWDISQPLRATLPVWPGDTAFSLERTWAMGPDCPVNVSRLTLSTHSGAHADAPLHYDESGVDAAAVDLTAYLGPCLVVDARGAGPLLSLEHLPKAALAGEARVLFRTYARFPHDAWTEEFTAIAPEVIEALSAAGVRLIGMDGPSLDPQTSKTMDAHHALNRARMHVLEGLVLDDVPPGRYELIALPLPIVGADASPVRAILRALA
jgi:arylformamidase